MRFDRDPQFEGERRRYRLAYTCDDCANWDPALDRCGNRFRTEPHRELPQNGTRLLFCKEFELA